MLLNRQRCQSIMADQRLDALIATQPANVMYAGDFFSLSHWYIAGTELYALLESDGQRPVSVIAPVGELDQAVQVPPEEVVLLPAGRTVLAGLEAADLPPEVRRFQSLAASPVKFLRPIEALIDLLQQRGLAGARVGIDELGLSAGSLEQLRAALPDLRIVPAAALFKQIRMVKTPTEVERLSKAIAATEAGIQVALAGAREGMTEREMAALYEAELVRHGARPFLSVIGFGHRSGFPNNIPSDNRLRKGDLIRFDVGCSYQGYAADTARIAVLGRADERLERYQEALIAGEEAALAEVRAGTPVRAIFPLAMEVVRRTIPHYFRGHVGHGIGLDVYEPPLLVAEAEGELLAGTVACVETPYYEFGLGGLQIEDTILVTADGYRALTTLPKGIIELD